MVRLNVGCGEFNPTGWLNIDMYQGGPVRPDRVVDVCNLPGDIVDVAAVYCGHVLEHLTPGQVGVALRALRRRMLPAAPIAVVGPDVHRAEAMWRAGQLDERIYRHCLAGAEGADRRPGDRHHWDCHEAAVVDHLRDAGFVAVTAVPIGSAELDVFPVVARDRWQCAALGYAP